MKASSTSKPRQRKPALKATTQREPQRTWDIDGCLKLTDLQVIDAAREYGYGGDDVEFAVKVLRRWKYKVKVETP
jgi:hypothetical protein